MAIRYVRIGGSIIYEEEYDDSDPETPYAIDTDGVVNAAGTGSVFEDLTINDLLIVGRAQLGDIAGGDYTEFESDGTMVAHGAGTCWEDIYPISIATGTNPATTPAFSVFEGVYRSYEFTGAGPVEELFLQSQVNHWWRQGSDVTPHCHLYIPNDAVGGTIEMKLDLIWDNVDSTGAGAGTTTLTGTLVVGASAGIKRNAILSFGVQSFPTKLISSIISMRLTRSSGGVDTFGSSVWLKSFDIHAEKDMLGSRTAFVK